MELPTRITGVPMTSDMNLSSMRVLACTVELARRPGVRPNPQVQGDDAAASGQRRSDQAPVQVRAAQPVHEHDRDALGLVGIPVLVLSLVPGGRELDPVHGTVEVGDEAGGIPGSGEVIRRRAE